MSETLRSGHELYSLIRQMDAGCMAQRQAMPHDAPPPDSWAAVLFRVRDQRFLTPLAQIAEVLEVPGDVTRIPGTKPWFLGIANNRGTLLPIYDLASLMQGGAPQRHRLFSQDGGNRRNRDRVLVVRQAELPCGLAVSEAIGMRQVQNSEPTGPLPDDLGASRPYVESSFRIDGDWTPVIRLDRLIADPIFNAAAT